jgi:formylglycine-generating enzyme required for sulfatase activity
MARAWPAVVLATACSMPPPPACSVECALDGSCAGSLTCGIDGYCHGDATELCGPSPTSCIDHATTCGSGTLSCCANRYVPGGSFDRGNDTSVPASVSAFRLDRFEVTVGRFRSFVDAGRGTQATAPDPGAGGRTLNGATGQGGWDASWTASLAADTTALRGALASCGPPQTWKDLGGPGDDLPMDCVTWFEAMAFCVWDGGFLPTEAEWNFAAAAGGAQRVYPWSNPPSATTVDCSDANFAGCGAGPAAVGADSPAGDGAWGHADLSGNVGEWVLDWDGGYPRPCIDCANLAPTTNRRTRGGGFDADTLHLRTPSQDSAQPQARYANLGFRCARAP